MTSFTVTLPCENCNATGWEDLTKHGTIAGGQWADIRDKVVSNFTSIWDVADEYLECTQIVSNEIVSLETEQKKTLINEFKHTPWRFVEYGIAKREEIASEKEES